MKSRILYFIITIIFSLWMLSVASIYLFKTEEVEQLFIELGYGKQHVFLLAGLKITGIIAIWLKNYKTLKTAAYIGFATLFMLASYSHWQIEDGLYFVPLIALLLLGLSFIFGKKSNK